MSGKWIQLHICYAFDFAPKTGHDKLSFVCRRPSWLPLMEATLVVRPPVLACLMRGRWRALLVAHALMAVLTPRGSEVRGVSRVVRVGRCGGGWGPHHGSQRWCWRVFTWLGTIGYLGGSAEDIHLSTSGASQQSCGPWSVWHNKFTKLQNFTRYNIWFNKFIKFHMK
jgi:hypothetical protein